MNKTPNHLLLSALLLLIILPITIAATTINNQEGIVNITLTFNNTGNNTTNNTIANISIDYTFNSTTTVLVNTADQTNNYTYLWNTSNQPSTQITAQQIPVTQQTTPRTTTQPTHHH